MRNALSVWTLVFFLLAPLPAAAAITGSTIWEVRTTGNDSNGGGYDPLVTAPGTDESQADAGTAVTVIIGATTTQGTSNPVFSATTHGPGNVYNQTGGAGCTVGRFLMLSQSGGTATFDRALGTAASTCTGIFSGGLATLGAANTAAPAGGTIWLKAGTYTSTTTLSVTVDRTIRGYTTTRGDRATRPTYRCSTDSTHVITKNAADILFWLDNLIVATSSATPSRGLSTIGTNTGRFVLTDVKWAGPFSADGAIYSLTPFSSMVILRNEFVTAAAIFDVASLYVADTLFNGAQATMSATSAQWTFERCRFINHANSALRLQNAALSLVVRNSVFYGNATAGLSFGTGTSQTLSVELTNNVFYGNTQYGIDAGAANKLDASNINMQSNAFGGNGTAAQRGFTTGANAIALTQNPFTNAAAGDFSLNSTPGGGAALKGLGYPAAAGALDIGAVQSVAPPALEHYVF